MTHDLTTTKKYHPIWKRNQHKRIKKTVFDLICDKKNRDLFLQNIIIANKQKRREELN